MAKRTLSSTLSFAVAPLLFVACASVTACSGTASEEATGGAVAPAHPVLARLQLRDRTLTLFASRDGVRVTVVDEAGKVLAEDVPVEALRARDPLAYEVCRSSLAAASPSNNGLDARVVLPAHDDARPELPPGLDATLPR